MSKIKIKYTKDNDILHFNCDSDNVRFFDEGNKELRLVDVNGVEVVDDHEDHDNDDSSDGDVGNEGDDNSGFHTIPLSYIEKYKDTTISEIPKFINSKIGEVIEISLSLPAPGGRFAGSYTVPVNCQDDPSEWKYKVIDLRSPILEVNPHYGKESLVRELKTAFSLISEVVLLDSGVDLRLKVLNGGEYEPKVRELDYYTTTKVTDEYGDLKVLTTDIPDMSPECPRSANMLGYMYGWYNSEFGKTSNKGFSLQLDTKDRLFTDDDPRLREGVSWSLLVVLVHELLHAFGLSSHSNDHGHITHGAIDRNKTFAELYPNGLLDQYEVRVRLRKAFGTL